MAESENSRLPTVRERMRMQREEASTNESSESVVTKKDESQQAEKPARPRTLREILSEENPSRSASNEGDNTSGRQTSQDGENRQKPAKLTDLNSLAETLKVKPEDLYKIKIPLGGDRTLTLGEIKDLATKDTDYDAREFDFEERRNKQEGDLLRAKNEIQELLAVIPPKLLNQELLNKVRTKYGEFVNSQRRETLNLIPEWKDEKVREAESAEMIDHLAEYGISKAEFMNLVDAKAIRYIRVNWLRQKRVERLMEQVQQQNTKGNAPARASGGKAPRKPPARDPKVNNNSRARMMEILNK